MTTFAELKTQVATLLADPSAKTFGDADIGYFINAGIAEVGRIAPQRFTEDINLNPGQLDYRVRGGTGNLIANPSFEEGDPSVLDHDISVTTGTDDNLLGGWLVSSTMTLNFIKTTMAQTGQRAGRITHAIAEGANNISQDIPVNPGATYIVSGWHWKAVAGGTTNQIRVHSLNSSNVIVGTDVIVHGTTAATPQYMSGSYTVPTDGSIAFLRVACHAVGGGGTQQFYYFEDISLVEAGDSNLVANNAVGDIELKRAEVWTVDDGTNPAHMVFRMNPASGEYVNSSEAGWELWDGVLHIPYRIFINLDPSIHYVRIWGYAPYDKLTVDTQVTDLSNELEQAVVAYCKVAGLEKLSMSRDLFSQWQTAMGNSDVSPASLLSALNLARDDWRRTKHALMVLREAP